MLSKIGSNCIRGWDVARLSPLHPSPFLVQLPIHLLPPPRPKPLHRPNDDAAPHRNHPHAGEQPAVSDGVDERLRDDGAHAREDVAHEVVDRDAVGRLFGHEFRQHRRRHGEDEHGADAEEEVCDQGHEPEDAPLRRPAVPDQRGWVQEGGDPGVFPHPVLGDVH